MVGGEGASNTAQVVRTSTVLLTHPRLEFQMCPITEIKYFGGWGGMQGFWRVRLQLCLVMDDV
jgi:hypothetical protein